MIKNSPIVNDTRKIRRAISDRFDNDIDKYIDYLLFKESEVYAVNNIENRANPAIKRTQMGSAIAPPL